MNSSQSSLFDAVAPFPGDAILALMEEFRGDRRSQKVSLSIGMYFDEEGRLPTLGSVRAAEAALLAEERPRGYLPMEGLADYREAAQRLLFGASSEPVRSGRIATVQTLGGSGALKLGADFLSRQFPGSNVYVSNPTWDNHFALFASAGLAVDTYPYFDAAANGVDFERMCARLQSLAPHSVVLLHASCHNPTGVDLTRAQWEELIPLFRTRGLIPFIDLAYQGFGDGLEEDAFALRMLADAGLEFLVANSFSKNFSLYGERCGALSVVCADSGRAGAVLGQLASAVRGNYSTPPIHGATVIARVLRDPALFEFWQAELGAMRQRMRDMRSQLHAALMRSGIQKDFGYLLEQRGMFSYTGLDEKQVDALRNEHGVYLVRSGRLCVSGLSTRNVNHVAQAMAAVLR